MSPKKQLISLCLFLSSGTVLLSCDGGGDELTSPETPALNDPPVTSVFMVPSDNYDTSWLQARSDEQFSLAIDWTIDANFQFSDQRVSSGIDWTHEITDDAAISYKAVHYDHGNGVVVADVNGDGLTDILFVNQLGDSGLWKNQGDGTFVDITIDAGLSGTDFVSVGAAFADTDNDGDADLYITNIRNGNRLYINDGQGHFSIAENSGVNYVGHSSGPIFFDYDNDGLVDLFVSNVGTYTTDLIGPGGYLIGLEDAFQGHLMPGRTEISRLFQNQGDNVFLDVTLITGLNDFRWTGDAHPLDFNNDGWMDLYVLNMQGLDGYWQNVNGVSFVDRTEEFFPRTSWGAMGIQVFDLENDGDMDIYITDMHSDMLEGVVDPSLTAEKDKSAVDPQDQDFLQDNGMGIYGNSFFRNDGSGTFNEVSNDIGAENFWPWGLSAADFNADGYMDVFITASMNYPFRYGINSLLLNDEGAGFVDAEFVLGIEPRQSGETKFWFQIDCRGNDSDHEDCPSQNNMGRVDIHGSLGSRSSVSFDIEGDGDLDIITNEFNSPPLVLVSNLSEQREINWLTVKLIGNQSNRDGLGAKVTVKLDGMTLNRYHDGKTGYLGQSSLPLYFGLGSTTEINEVHVSWPSGQEQILTNPDTNQLLVITEPN